MTNYLLSAKKSTSLEEERKDWKGKLANFSVAGEDGSLNLGGKAGRIKMGGDFMTGDNFEVALFIPAEPKVFPVVQMFIRTTRSQFSSQELPEIQLFGSSSRQELRVVYRFRSPDSFLEVQKLFSTWIKALNIRIRELSNLAKEELRAVWEEIKAEADVVYTGDFDLERAMENLKISIGRFSEVRQYPRFREKLEVFLQMDDKLIGEYTGNISLGGMFIQNRTDIPPRTRLTISLRLPGRTEMLTIYAEVVHVIPENPWRDPKTGKSSGFGVKFVEVDEESRRRLAEYLKVISQITTH